MFEDAEIASASPIGLQNGEFPAERCPKNIITDRFRDSIYVRACLAKELFFRCLVTCSQEQQIRAIWAVPGHRRFRMRFINDSLSSKCSEAVSGCFSRSESEVVVALSLQFKIG